MDLSVAHPTADMVRYITLFVTLLVIALFPAATLKQGRRPSAWFAVLGAELVLVSAALGVMSHMGEKLVWYRTPLLLVGAGTMLAFVVIVFTETGLTRQR